LSEQDACFRIARFRLEHRLQKPARLLATVRSYLVLCLLHELPRLRWNGLLQPLPDRVFRGRTHALVHDLPIHEELHSRDATNSVASGLARMDIRVHLYQAPPAGGLLCQLLEDRPKNSTWPTPGSPKIHDSRRRATSFDDVLLEVDYFVAHGWSVDFL